MDYHKLFRPGQPTFYMVAGDESGFDNLYLQLAKGHKEAVIRKVRGNKSSTVAEFFNEVGAAFQFPYYFGENWPAFSECITDLDWLVGDVYLMLISRANLLFSNAGIDDFRNLMRILADANREWMTPNKYIPRERSATAFHVIFQCAPEDFVSFSQRLVQVDIKLETL
jgi:hypothetical protein